MIWIIWIPENYLSKRGYDQVVAMSESTQTQRQRVRTELIGGRVWTPNAFHQPGDVHEHNRQRLPGPHSLITIINRQRQSLQRAWGGGNYLGLGWNLVRHQALFLPTQMGQNAE